MKTVGFLLSVMIILIISSISGDRQILSSEQEEWTKLIEGAAYFIFLIKVFFPHADESDDCIGHEEDAEDMDEDEYNKPGSEHPRIDELYSKAVLKYLKERDYFIVRYYSGDRQKSFIGIDHESGKAVKHLRNLNLRAKRYRDIERKQTLLALPRN